VLGGCDGLFDPGPGHQIPGQDKSLAFFNQVLKGSADSFDIFDLHLYADPYTIPGRIEYIRNQMRSYGYTKPIIATEYNGPGFFEFPQNRKYFGLMQSWSQPAVSVPPSTVVSGAVRNRITELYEQINSLAPQTQMFLMGCSPQLEQKIERIQARDLVMRNVLAFSSGVQKTAFWDIWHDTSKRDDLQTLMFGKLKLVAFENERFVRADPLADVYRRMTSEFEGIAAVRRIVIPSRPDAYVFEIDRGKRGRLFVAWDKGDAFTGEDTPAVPLEFDGGLVKPNAVDVFGNAIPVTSNSGKLSLNLSVTPVYIRAAG
jgi:hypothetical protein